MGASGTSKDPLDQLEEVLTFEQARPRAAGVVNPEYNRMMQQTLDSLRRQQMARGMYGQLPADVFTQGQAADIEAARAQAIIDYANMLVEQSKASALQKRGLDLQQQGLDLQANYQMGMLANQAAQLRQQRELYELGILASAHYIPESLFKKWGIDIGGSPAPTLKAAVSNLGPTIDAYTSNLAMGKVFDQTSVPKGVGSVTFNPGSGFSFTGPPAGTAGMKNPYLPTI